MTFYTVSYLESHQQFNQVVNSVAITILILGIGLMTFQYFRHRLVTWYRDLGILFTLILLVFIGISISNIQKTTTEDSEATAMIPFLRSVARDYKVPVKDVSANSTSLADGVVVRIKTKNYRINLDSSSTNYTLTPTHVINKTATVLTK